MLIWMMPTRIRRGYQVAVSVRLNDQSQSTSSASFDFYHRDFATGLSIMMMMKMEPYPIGPYQSIALSPPYVKFRFLAISSSHKFFF